MSNPESLADSAVDVIAAVRAMADGVELEHPDRHIVHDLKRQAEGILRNAFRQARDLAYTSEGIQALRASKSKEPSCPTPGS